MVVATSFGALVPGDKVLFEPDARGPKGERASRVWTE
jgi:cold shock CspA family protein